MRDPRRVDDVSKTIIAGGDVVGLVPVSEGLEQRVGAVANNPFLQKAGGVKGKVLVYSLNAYQTIAMSTKLELSSKQADIDFSALEIASEAGEVVNIVYKCIYQGHDLDKEHMVEELGDLLWGIASMASAIGVTMTDVASANINKLAKRYKSGKFSTTDSIARVDHKK